jgi:hypothetical protein
MVANYLPDALDKETDFKNFLQNKGQNLAYELSDFLMMTLPEPRVDYYQSSNYFDI